MSLPEVTLWGHLRGDSLAGHRFRRQHAIGPYILDFYCAEARLCVEIDGYSHDNAAAQTHDLRRTAWLDEQGVTVLRIPAPEVLNNLEGVLQAIALAVAPSTGSAGPPPPLREGG